MPWEPIKIDAPKKRHPTAEERSAATAREEAKKRVASAAKESRLDAFLGPSCPRHAELQADPTILQGRRPKCLARHGEHTCTLAGPSPPRPGHTSEHRCACGATWSVT